MTKEEAIIKIQRLRDEFNETYVGYDGTNEAVDMAIESLLKEEPTEEEIIKYCHSRCLAIISSEDYEHIKCGLIPVKTGKWIDDEDPTLPSHCSVCGESALEWVETRYCPWCGAKMENKE